MTLAAVNPNDKVERWDGVIFLAGSIDTAAINQQIQEHIGS